MIRAIFVIALIFCASVRSEDEIISAACGRGGTLNVCKQPGRRNCLAVESRNTCINLVGGPFISGVTAGRYQCTVFKNRGCGGLTNSVNNYGGDFTFVAASLRCPCI